MSELTTPFIDEDEQIRPQLATLQVMLLFGLIASTLLLTLYYFFAIQTNMFSDQTHTLESGSPIIVLISGFCVVGVMVAMRFNVVSFPVIFIGSTFLFNLGQFVVLLLEDVTLNWYIKSVSSRYFIEALPVMGLAFTGLLFGVAVASLGNEKRLILNGSTPAPINLDTDIVRVLRHIGYALYFLAIGLTVYYALRGTGLALAIRYGYAAQSGQGYASATAAGEIPALATASLFWFAPWASLILLATAKGQWEKIFVILLALGSCALTLLAGDRFVPVALCLGIISTAHLRGQKFRWWQIGIVFLAIFFIVSTWARIRVISVQDWDVETFGEVLTNTTTGEYRGDNNERQQYNFAVSRLFRQTGQSYIILPATIKLIDDGEPYHYGIDYIRTMGSAIPFAGSALVSWRQTPSEWFDDQYLNKDSLRGLGFSIVSEAYLQGGPIGVLLVHAILGFSMAAIWFALERRPNANGIAYVMIVVSSAYIWVRDDMTEIAKPAVWGLGLTFIIPLIIIHAVKQRKYD